MVMMTFLAPPMAGINKAMTMSKIPISAVKNLSDGNEFLLLRFWVQDRAVEIIGQNPGKDIELGANHTGSCGKQCRDH